MAGRVTSPVTVPVLYESCMSSPSAHQCKPTPDQETCFFSGNIANSIFVPGLSNMCVLILKGISIHLPTTAPTCYPLMFASQFLKCNSPTCSRATSVGLTGAFQPIGLTFACWQNKLSFAHTFVRNVAQALT